MIFKCKVYAAKMRIHKFLAVHLEGKLEATCTGCPKIIVPRLCGCCGGAVDSVISVFTQFHSLGFNVECETLCKSI